MKAFILKHRMLIAGLLTVLAVRLVFVASVCYQPGSVLLQKLVDALMPISVSQVCGERLQADAFIYDHLGKKFAEQGRLDLDELGLPNTVVSPGFPVFLGSVYALFGQRTKAIILVYAFLDTLTALLCILCLRSSGIRYQRGTEPLFLCMFAVYLPYITVVLAPLSEGLFTFLIVAALLLILRAGAGKSLFGFGAAGFVMGLAVLTRPLVLLLPVWMGMVWLLFAGAGNRKGVVLRYGILFAVMIAVLVPWTVRNYMKYDRLIFITSDKKPLVLGSGVLVPESGSMTNAERSRAAYRETAGTGIIGIAGKVVYAMAGQPLKTARRLGVKLCRLWMNLGFKGRPSAGSVFAGILQALLILGAAGGAFRAFRTHGSLWPLWAFFWYTTIMHVLFFTAKIRFITPAMPVIFMQVALILSGMVSAYKGPERKPDA